MTPLKRHKPSSVQRKLSSPDPAALLGSNWLRLAALGLLGLAAAVRVDWGSREVFEEHHFNKQEEPETL